MAEFTTKCPHCKAELVAEEEWNGMEVTCPTCKRNFTVEKDIPLKPTPSPASASPASDSASPAEESGTEDSFIFICPQCDTQVELPIAMKGKKYECKACFEESVAQPATEKKCPHCGKSIKIKATTCKYCKRKVTKDFSGIMEKSKEAVSSSLRAMPGKLKKANTRKAAPIILFVLSGIAFVSSCIVLLVATCSNVPTGWSCYSLSNEYGSVTVGDSSYGTYRNAKYSADNLNDLLKTQSVFKKFHIGFGLQGIAIFLFLSGAYLNLIFKSQTETVEPVEVGENAADE